MTGALVVQGDALRLPLPDGSVDLVITSPPYHRLRSYDAGPGEIGSEPTPTEYLEALWAATAEMARVLKPTGSIMVDLGDKYSTGNSGDSGLASWSAANARGGAHTQEPAKQRSGRVQGMPPKCLLLLPERYRIGCVDHLGLIARAVICWSKPNSLPESVVDRVRRSHEDWVHLTRFPRYYSAIDEVREPHNDRAGPPSRFGNITQAGESRTDGIARPQTFKPAVREYNPLGKLPGSVWTIPSEPLRLPEHLGVDHYAAFPSEWPRRLILGWSPPGVCVDCRQGRVPVVETDWSKIPHRMVEKRVLSAEESARWCEAFADWCGNRDITRADLDAAAGTSDMGGWWASRLAHRAQVPTPDQWAKLAARLGPMPSELAEVVHSTRVVPVALRDVGEDVAVTGRHRTTGGGTGESVKTILGYACSCTPFTDHPGSGNGQRGDQPWGAGSTPDRPRQNQSGGLGNMERVGPWREYHLDRWKPPPTRPSVVLDPFMGTGTVPMVARALGRVGVGVDLSFPYCRAARWRIHHDAGKAISRTWVERQGQLL